MLSILSPPETLGLDAPVDVDACTLLAYLPDSRRLLRRLHELPAQGLADIIYLSPKFAEGGYRHALELSNAAEWVSVR